MPWTAAHALNPNLAGALEASPGRIVNGRLLLHDPAAGVVPGTICSAARRHYANGQCALLTLAILAERPLAHATVVHPLGRVDEWVHALAALPGVGLLDIDGLRPARGAADRWNEIAPSLGPFVLSPLSDRRTERLLGHLDRADSVEREVAITFARSLLSSLGL